MKSASNNIQQVYKTIIFFERSAKCFFLRSFFQDYPINATYLLPTAKSESLTKWSSIDRSKLQNSVSHYDVFRNKKRLIRFYIKFENALNLKQKNVLEVMQIGQETALSRRKR